jgi:hypothetical protein
MYYIFNGMIFRSEEQVSEYIFNKLGRYVKYPTEEMVAAEWESDGEERDCDLRDLIREGYELYV